jgi:hypothetical protein
VRLTLVIPARPSLSSFCWKSLFFVARLEAAYNLHEYNISHDIYFVKRFFTFFYKSLFFLRGWWRWAGPKKIRERITMKREAACIKRDSVVDTQLRSGIE